MGSRTRIGVLSMLVISSCATQPEQASSSSPPAVSPAPVKAPEPEDGRVEVTGHLLAHDGTPLRRAELTIVRDGLRKSVASAVLDGEGSFRVSIPPGVYVVTIAAVDHHVATRRTVITDDLRVEGRLGTYALATPGDALTIRGEYLDEAGKVVGRAPSSAARVSDRVYALELPAKPQSAVRLRYQLADPSGRTYNGPLADDYANDGGGDFWSIVDVKGKDALELDLRAQPPPGKAAELRWTGEHPTTAAMLDFHERWSAALDELRSKTPRKDGKLLELTDELRAEAQALAAKARTEVDAAKDPATHALLRLAHLSVFYWFLAANDDGVAALRDEVAWVIEHVPPTDPHLGLLYELDNALFTTRKDADEAFLASTDAWLERRAREHAEPSAAIGALAALLFMADARGDEARVNELYALAVDERFDGMIYQRILKEQYDPNRVLKRGNPFPEFDFEGLGPGDARVTSRDRAGKLYMIEFWATWCGPCVAEMVNLHAAYAAINGAKRGKGSGEEGLRRLRSAKRPKVEFVFVSLDGSSTEVEAFRKQHWSMPWVHAFVGRDGQPEVMKQFGFSGVPTTVLVDEAGTIVTVEGLRGEQLLPTLEQAVAERSGKGSTVAKKR